MFWGFFDNQKKKTVFVLQQILTDFLLDARPWDWNMLLLSGSQPLFIPPGAPSFACCSPPRHRFSEIVKPRVLLHWAWLPTHPFSIVTVQSRSHVQLFATPQTAACRLLCPSLSPRVYSNSCPLSRWWYPTISSSATLFSSCLQSFPASGSFPMSWPLHQVAKILALQYQSFSEYSGLISFRMDWFDLLAVQGTLKSLLQHHSSKTSILQHSVFFTLLHLYVTIHFPYMAIADWLSKSPPPLKKNHNCAEKSVSFLKKISLLYYIQRCFRVWIEDSVFPIIYMVMKWRWKMQCEVSFSHISSQAEIHMVKGV